MNDSETPQPPPDPPPPEAQPFIATLQGVWERIKHHKVVQWTLAYLAIAYTLLHGAEMLTGSLGWPHGWVRLFTLLLILGVPIVITLAWYHGSRGQQRASGTEIMIIALLLALGGAFLWRDSGDHEEIGTPREEVAPLSVAALPVVPVVPHEKSIAVLPFVDMSAEKNQEYMADGIAEELLNLLAQVPGLKVMARTSSFAFKNKNVDIAEIATKLNVAHVLEGSVRTSGDKLRVTAQLVRTADGTHLWSERFDRPVNDIFLVQDEIANSIVQALQVQLAGGELNRKKGGTQNLQAYRLYLRARRAQYENTQSSLQAAEGYLEQATKIDPLYGLAWALLAETILLKTDSGWLDAREGYERTRRLAVHALEMSPELAHAHALLQYVYRTLDWNWAEAESEGQQALAIDPANPTVLMYGGSLDRTLGRWDEAERKYRMALARDPLNTVAIWELATNHYSAGRFAEAEGIYRQLLELAPNFYWTRPYLGKTLLAQGKAEAALAIVQDESDEGARLKYLPAVLQAAGRQTEADEALEAQIAYWADTGAYWVAQNYAYRGDRDIALEWLERAYEQKDPVLVEIVGEHMFQGLFEDPRFKAFLRKMKLPG